MGLEDPDGRRALNIQIPNSSTKWFPRLHARWDFSALPQVLVYLHEVFGVGGGG